MSVPVDPPAAHASRLAVRFEEDSLRYAFGGALALGAWGLPRTTADVGVSVFVPETGAGSFRRRTSSSRS